jgi:hypothetical protein
MCVSVTVVLLRIFIGYVFFYFCMAVGLQDWLVLTNCLCEVALRGHWHVLDVEAGRLWDSLSREFHFEKKTP